MRCLRRSFSSMYLLPLVDPTNFERECACGPLVVSPALHTLALQVARKLTDLGHTVDEFRLSFSLCVRSNFLIGSSLFL